MTRIKNLTPEFESEAEFRKAAKKELEKNGFQVKSLSVWKRVPGQLANLADFEVRLPEWGSKFVRVEVKLGGKWHWSSDAQEQSYYNGELVVFFWMSDVKEWIAKNLQKELA